MDHVTHKIPTRIMQDSFKITYNSYLTGIMQGSHKIM